MTSPTTQNRRVYLTQAQLKLSVMELTQRLGCSKATASRAKRRGFYCPGYNGTAKDRARQRQAKQELKPLRRTLKPGVTIKLSPIELELSRNQLAKRYSIGHAQATEALQTGVLLISERKSRQSRRQS